VVTPWYCHPRYVKHPPTGEKLTHLIVILLVLPQILRV
jgi:hypothetical protein